MVTRSRGGAKFYNLMKVELRSKTPELLLSMFPLGPQYREASRLASDQHKSSSNDSTMAPETQDLTRLEGKLES